MVSTTSGTSIFNMDVDDIIEQALEPLGGQHTSGIEASKARRILNLILLQLQNKNIPLNKLETVPLTINVGDDEYTLDSDIMDVLKVSLNQSGSYFIPLERWSIKQFHDIPNKTTRQRPTIFTTERGLDSVNLKLWPVPNQVYTASILVSKKVEDVTASYQRIDLNTRYLPLLVSWLTYELALTKPDISLDKLGLLKMRYEEISMDTFDEDRERVTMSISPGGINGR